MRIGTFLLFPIHPTKALSFCKPKARNALLKNTTLFLLWFNRWFKLAKFYSIPDKLIFSGPSAMHQNGRTLPNIALPCARAVLLLIIVSNSVEDMTPWCRRSHVIHLQIGPACHAIGMHPWTVWATTVLLFYGRACHRKSSPKVYIIKIYIFKTGYRNRPFSQIDVLQFSLILIPCAIMVFSGKDKIIARTPGASRRKNRLYSELVQHILTLIPLFMASTNPVMSWSPKT